MGLSGINNDRSADQVEDANKQGSAKRNLMLWREEKQVRQQCADYEFNERGIHIACEAHDCHRDEVEKVRKALTEKWIQKNTNPRRNEKDQQCKRVLRHRAAKRDLP
jgi:hypothetical protein